MDLTPYVEHLRQELAVAAEAGGAEARALAERLTAPLESALRLTLLEALSAAADEITRDLAPGSVDVRLRARDAEFVVTPPPVEQFSETTADVPPVPFADTDDGATARINFRVPEQLKARIEEAAAAQQLSVNAWLSRVAAAATTGRDRQPLRRIAGIGEKYTGWAR